MVGSHSSYRCRPVGKHPIAHVHLGCCPRLDGCYMPAQCEAVWTHPLPVHRAVLPCDGHSSADACCPERSTLCVAGPGSAHSLGRQDHLVGDRACMGTLLFAEFTTCLKAHRATTKQKTGTAKRSRPNSKLAKPNK